MRASSWCTLSVTRRTNGCACAVRTSNTSRTYLGYAARQGESATTYCHLAYRDGTYDGYAAREAKDKWLGM